MQGLAHRVRAHVYHDAGALVVARRHGNRYAGTAHAGDQFEPYRRRAHRGRGVPQGDHAVDAALLQLAHKAHDGTVALLPEIGDLVLHLHDLRGVNEFEALGKAYPLLDHRLADAFLVSHHDHGGVVIFRQEALYALDYGEGTVVVAHRVDADTHLGQLPVFIFSTSR